jgi:hypothetical protein
MDQPDLPKSVLYAASARIGGVGFDAVALETLRGLRDQLGLAIAFGLRLFDLFHGWSGQVLHSLQTAKSLGIPRTRTKRTGR